MPVLLQAQTAKLQGRVTDPTGGVIPAAQIEIVNANSGVKANSETNSQGEYSLPFLQPGDYNLSVSRQGFKSFRRSNIHLDVDQTAAIDVTLQVGTLSETVEVTGASPLLQTQTASVGQTVDNKTVVTLPLNGRDYTQLVTLAAGAAPNNHSRATNGFSLNGSQTFQNTMLLDGIDNNNYILGADSGNMNAVTPSIDAIQEFHVETSNYSAQYGRSAGGVVSVSIKSGTNQFHGDAFEFFRNTVLNATDFFANRSGLQKPPLHRNQFGGVVGGPIVRNKSFFFISYQGQRQTSYTSSQATVPTAAELQGQFGSVNIYNPARVTNGARAQFPNNV
ncbi:MAG TPA: carboxypeptidase-like regulatory domain-containing protein, partial [Bryobacteraceae bacterium]